MQRWSKTRLASAGRFRRALTEFLVLPLLITGLFCAAAAWISVLDAQGDLSAVRRVVAGWVPGSGAASFLGTVAGSLMTVTSITFSVLLIALQQTSTSLGAVVFDQYLRRRSNQIHVGYFVGATSFSFIALASASPKSPPVLGAFTALLLTVGSLVALLLLIHATVDQMRPECVVESIHELALRAHETEVTLLKGTRRQRWTQDDDEGRDVRIAEAGYVVGIDPRALAAVARSAGPEVEVVLPCQMGSYVGSGEPVARLVGVGVDDDRFDADTMSAFRFDETRRIEVDAGYSVDQLENIAWMSGTSAQSPYTANAAIHQLEDLLARWADLESGEREVPPGSPEPFPVVYTDGAVIQVLDSLGTLLVASAESRQSDTSALLVLAFARSLPRLQSNLHGEALMRSLQDALPAMIRQVNSTALLDALTLLVAAIERTDRDAHQVRRVHTILLASNDRLRSDLETPHGAASPAGVRRAAHRRPGGQ